MNHIKLNGFLKNSLVLMLYGNGYGRRRTAVRCERVKNEICWKFLFWFHWRNSCSVFSVVETLSVKWHTDPLPLSQSRLPITSHLTSIHGWNRNTDKYTIFNYIFQLDTSSFNQLPHFLLKKTSRIDQLPVKITTTITSKYETN